MRRIALTLATVLLASACSDRPNINDGAIVAIKVTPDNPLTNVGDDLAFVATAYQVNGIAKDVTDLPGTTWASSDPAIVTLNADGSGQALSEGDAFVTASRAGLSSPAQHVTVAPAVIPSPSPSPTAPPPPSNHVLISEVMFNPLTEPNGQYVEIFNPTLSSVTVTGWVLTYNSAGGVSFTFPALTLAAGEFAVAANDTTLFNGTTYPAVTNLYTWPMANLSNTGDWFILKNNTGTMVDQMAYGTGYNTTKPAAWCGSNNPVSGNGQSTSRHPTDVDTDNCVDWASNTAPTPGQVNP